MSKKLPAVRLLPMSSNERSFRGRSVEDVQQWFFLDFLPSPPRNGRFRYPTAGLSAKPGSVVLFQYEACIIASGIFIRNERYEQLEDGFRGALWFEPRSIRTFRPVGRDEVREIWPEFINFGHVKQRLDPKQYSAFEKRLIDVAAPGENDDARVAEGWDLEADERLTPIPSARRTRTSG